MWAELGTRLRPALLVTRREVSDQLRDWRIIIPVFFLTVFFPFLMEWTAREMIGFVQRYGATIIAERFIPFLLMIVGFFPISVSLVIALETFVGEKERGSIEPLLCTPLEDWQLYLGKLLAATVPPLVSSLLGMLVYILGLYRQNIHLPPAVQFVQILLLTMVQAVVMVSGAVVISTQTTSVRAANLLASFIIIPIALLIQLEAITMFWGTSATLWWILAGLVVLAALLIRVGLAHFRREELLGREIDVLNLRWGLQVFRSAFTGGAHSLREWYLNSVIRLVGKMRLPILFTALALAAAFWAGDGQAHAFQFSLQAIGYQDIHARLAGMTSGWPLAPGPVLAIWSQNLRVLGLSLLLGIFSFGVLGMIPAMATFGITGYLARLMALNGISPGAFLAGFILPHGLLEVPAVILACAAVLRMGALLATPDVEKTIGQVWIEALADWAKVMLALVVPLLLLAAAVEAWLTPRLALLLFH